MIETFPASSARRLPPNLSTLVLRLNDRAMLVALDQPGDHDLTGREIIPCMVLTDEESKHALELADEALSTRAMIVERLGETWPVSIRAR